MKTSKNRTRKKDWQKADARILGQILAAQNVDFVLPDSTHIAEFFAETLIAIPGIEVCRVCLHEVSVQRGEMGVGVCESCEASREKVGSNEEVSSFEPDFECRLVSQPDVQFSIIASPFHHFGFFVFQVNDLDAFNVYKPFIDNLANYVALSLENRQQKDLLQKARDELEFRVAERTEELRASNEAIRDLYNNAPCGYHSLDKDGFFILINDTELRWLGYSRDEIVGKVTFRSLLSNNSLQTFDANFSGFKERGWVSDLEFEMVRKDGSILPVLLNATAVTDSNGNYVMSRSTIFDITERRHTEESLRKMNERFSLATHAAHLGVWDWDIQKDELVWDDAMYELYGVKREDFAGAYDAWLKGIHPDDRAPSDEISKKAQRGEREYDTEFRVVWPDGSIHYLKAYGQFVRDADDKPLRMTGINLDITERRLAEQALRENEEKFRTLIEQSAEGVMLADEDGNIVEWNHAYEKITGLKQSQVLGQPLWEMMMKIISPGQATMGRRESIKAGILEALRTGKSHLFAAPIEMEFYPPSSGEKRYLRQTIFPIRTEKGYRAASLIEDITERKKAEEQLLASEQLFRALVENSPDFIARYDREFRRIYVNPAIQKLFGTSTKNVLGKTPSDQSPLYAPQVYIDHLRRTIETVAESVVEIPYRTAQGEMHWGQMRFVPEFGPDGTVDSVLAIGRDIHEIKENERRFRMLAENFPDFVVRFNRDGQYIYANPAFEKVFGMPVKSIIGRTLQEVPQRGKTEQNNESQYLIRRTFDEGVANEFQEVWDTKMGERIFEVRYVPEKDATGNVVTALCIARDITEHKQHEREREAIIAVSTALRHATTRTEILNVILDQLVDLFDADGATLVLPNPQSGGFIDEMGRGVVGERMIGLNIPHGKGVCNWVVTNRKPYLNNHAENDPFFYRPDLLGDSHCIASVPLITQDHVIGALWIARKMDILEQDLRLLNAIADIAANAIRRVILYEQTEKQLRHLLALHQIDIAISNNFDSTVTLNVILNKVKGELEVDAVSILLLDSATHTLDYAAGIGFMTRGIEQSHVGLGDGCAGCAAKECRTVSCLDIGHTDGAFIRSSLLADEDFVLHYATPLVVKGEVKGVLELFHRNAFEPEKEWLDYYETLATQAAIAIENASLLENLQRSNAELTLAYDATIEGWSRALDLRDKETEGHTQRVAHMALELAEKMGMGNTEKQDLWRGSLLHDIGKMGVPDSILLKPGPLTDSEREIMQQHPLYAYQMLSPISYLKHSLEIPYCHHEKWDGSGYPRGLKGDEIPLFARVFAVVDVYDALTSDRPYREAWPPEKAYRYIQEQAGRHFDPQVVKAFLDRNSR